MDRRESDGGEGAQIGQSLAKAAGRVALGVLALAVPFMIVPWLPRAKFGALPYMHTSQRRTDLLVGLLRKHLATRKRRPKFVDLGSGDGIVVIAAAKNGFHAIGVELNPVLVAVSHVKAVLYRTSPVAQRVIRLVSRQRLANASDDSDPTPGSSEFRMGNLFDADITDADCVMCFGVGPIMSRLSYKLAKELQPGSLVALNRFVLPPEHGWSVLDRMDTITIYRVESETYDRVRRATLLKTQAVEERR